MSVTDFNRCVFLAALWALLLLPAGVVVADTLIDGGINTVQNEIALTLIPGQPGNLVMAYNDNRGL